MTRHLFFAALLVALTACGEPEAISVNQGGPTGEPNTDVAERFARAFEGSVILYTTYFDTICECGDGQAVFCEDNDPGLIDEVSACIRDAVESGPPPPDSLEGYLLCHEANHPEVFACADEVKAAADTCESADEVDFSCIDELDGQDSTLEDCESLIDAEIRSWFDDATIDDCHP